MTPGVLDPLTFYVTMRAIPFLVRCLLCADRLRLIFDQEQRSSCQSTSLGSKIPQELFERFAHFLSGGDCAIFPEERGPHYLRPNPLTLTKRELGSCSLVCWMWARALRRRIFQELELRSHDDARQLIDYAQCDLWTTDFRVSAFVGGLVLFQDVRHHSWIHSITHFSSMFPELGDNISLKLSMLDGGLEATAPFPNTVHHHLPRTLPPAALREVILEQPFFSNFDDLMSLVSSTTLQALEIRSPRWHESVHLMQQPHKQMRPTRRPVVQVYVKYKSNPRPGSVNSGSDVQNPMWLLVWLLTTTRTLRLIPNASRHLPTRIVRTSRSDISKLVELVKTLWCECRCALCTHRDAEEQRAGEPREVVLQWVCSPKPRILGEYIATGTALHTFLEVVVGLGLTFIDKL